MAQTRQDRWCEFDPSMGSRDTWTDNFQGSSCVLYGHHGHHVFYDQSMTIYPLHARVKIISHMCLQL